MTELILTLPTRTLMETIQKAILLLTGSGILWIGSNLAIAPPLQPTVPPELQPTPTQTYAPPLTKP